MESIKTYRMGIGIFVLILLVTAVPAGAYVRVWDGSGANSYWATAGNWDPYGYSNSDDLTVLSGSPTSVSNVYADNGGTITLEGPSAVANFGLFLYIAHSADASGRLEVLNGANVSNACGFVGYNSGASGSAKVSDAGSAWTNREELYIGVFTGASGWLDVLNGANVSNTTGYLGFHSGASGTVTVSGGSNWTSIGSRVLYVGYYGAGALSITDGGDVSGWRGCLGYDGSGSGEVTVSGTGSTWTNTSYLYVGNSGTGTLSITNGGAVSNTTGYLGYYMSGSGEVTVSGIGSTWTNSEYLRVGEMGAGVLSITDGGAVSSANGYLGLNNSSSGEVTVSGDGSNWTNSGDLCVGYYGTGVLTIRDGASVDTEGNLSIGAYSAGNGTVNLEGGSLTVGTITSGYGTAVFNFTGGFLSVETFQFQGNLVNNGGTIAPGSSAGLMTVDGDLIINAGAMEIELAGSTVRGTDYDAIDVTGTLTLAGTLDVVLIDDFDPGLDDTFDILDWGSLTGKFDTVNLPGLSGGLDWDDSNLYGDGTITVVPEPASAVLLLSGGVLAMLRRRRK